MWNEKKIRKAIRRKQGEGKGGRIDESAESKKNGEAGRKKNEKKGMKKRRRSTRRIFFYRIRVFIKTN